MDMEEISRSCAIPTETLKKYARCGILVEGEEEVSQENIRRIGIVDTLLKAGISAEEAGKFFFSGGKTQRLYWLKEHRKKLLSEIHAQEHVLGRMDDLIWEEQKGVSIVP